MGNRFIKDVPVPSLEDAFKDRYIIPADYFNAYGKPVEYDAFDTTFTYKNQTMYEPNLRTGYGGRIHSRAIPLLEKLLTGADYKFRIRYIKVTDYDIHSGWYVDVCNPVHPNAYTTSASMYVRCLVDEMNEIVENLYR